MQAKNDDDLHGGQRSSEVKCGKLCYITNIVIPYYLLMRRDVWFANHLQNQFNSHPHTKYHQGRSYGSRDMLRTKKPWTADGGRRTDIWITKSLPDFKTKTLQFQYQIIYKDLRLLKLVNIMLQSSV